MEPHNSRPYNPDIANVFYHAGYIEHWGQGIEKICRSCKQIGADVPTYELIGSSIRVRFEALKSALLNEPKAPKHLVLKKNKSLKYSKASQAYHKMTLQRTLEFQEELYRELWKN